MIDEVLKAQGQTEEHLSEQRLQPVLDQKRVAAIAEATRESADQPRPSIKLSQEQGARVGGDGSAVEIGLNNPPIKASKIDALRVNFAGIGAFLDIS